MKNTNRACRWLRNRLWIPIITASWIVFASSSANAQSGQVLTREYIRLGSKVIAIENNTLISPTTVSLQPRQTQVFTAQVPVNWTLSGSLSNLGTLSTAGPSTSVTYTPPPSNLSSPVVLTATNPNNANNRATATINFVAPPMSLGGVVPASGLGTSQIFTFTFTDGDVAGISLTTPGLGFAMAFLPTSVTLGASPSPVPSACEIATGTTSWYLVTDTGAYTGPGVVGSSTVLSNSQCSINMASANISINGSTITLTVPVTFAASYGPALNVWANIYDGFPTGLGFKVVGSWNVQ